MRADAAPELSDRSASFARMFDTTHPAPPSPARPDARARSTSDGRTCAVDEPAGHGRVTGCGPLAALRRLLSPGRRPAGGHARRAWWRGRPAWPPRRPPGTAPGGGAACHATIRAKRSSNGCKLAGVGGAVRAPAAGLDGHPAALARVRGGADGLRDRFGHGRSFRAEGAASRRAAAPARRAVRSVSVIRAMAAASASSRQHLRVAPHRLDPGRGEPDEGAAPVGGVAVAHEQPPPLQPVDDLADHRLRPVQVQRSLADRQRTGVGEVAEHGTGGGGQAAAGSVAAVVGEVDGAEEGGEGRGVRAGSAASARPSGGPGSGRRAPRGSCRHRARGRIHRQSRWIPPSSGGDGVETGQDVAAFRTLCRSWTSSTPTPDIPTRAAPLSAATSAD